MKIQEFGRSMTEMLGVLAIVGILSVTAIVGYQYAINKYRANMIVNEVSKRSVIALIQIQSGKELNLSEFGTIVNDVTFSGVFEDPNVVIAAAVIPEKVCKATIDMVGEKWAYKVNGIDKGACQESDNVMDFIFDATQDTGSGENPEEPDHSCADVECPGFGVCDPSNGKCVCTLSCADPRKVDEKCAMCVCQDPTMMGLNCDVKPTCPSSLTASSSPSNPSMCAACPNKGIVDTRGTCYGCDSSSSVNMGSLIDDTIYGCIAMCPNRWIYKTECKKGDGSCPTISTSSSNALSPQACKACANKGIVGVGSNTCYGCDSSRSVNMGDLVNDPVYGCKAVCPNRYVIGTYCYKDVGSCPTSSAGSVKNSAPMACKACTNKGVVDIGDTCYGCDSSSYVNMGDLVNDPVYGCTAVCPNRFVKGTTCYKGGGSCPSLTSFTENLTYQMCAACPGVADRNIGFCFGCDYSGSADMESMINDPVYGCAAVCPNRYVSGTYCMLGNTNCPSSSTDYALFSSPGACKACKNKGIVDDGGRCYACNSSTPVDMESMINDPVYGCKAVCPNRYVIGTYCYKDVGSCPSSPTDYSKGLTPQACAACPNKGVVTTDGICYGCDFSASIYMGDLINDPVYGCKAVCPDRYVIGTSCNKPSTTCPSSSTSYSSGLTSETCAACPNKGIVDAIGTCYGCDYSSYVNMGDLVNDSEYGCAVVCPNRYASETYCYKGNDRCPTSPSGSVSRASSVACAVCPNKGIVGVGGTCYGCDYSGGVDMGPLINDSNYGCTAVCPNRYVNGTMCYFG